MFNWKICSKLPQLPEISSTFDAVIDVSVRDHVAFMKNKGGVYCNE